MSEQAPRTKTIELCPLTFSGAVPRPHPPCADPTPDEQYRHFIAQRQQNLDSRQQQQQQQQNQQNDGTSSGGAANNFFNSAASNFRSLAQQIGLGIERATTEVSNITETQVRQLERQINSDRFRHTFPELSAMGEVLLADYACAAMHNGQRVVGHVHITKNYLCFSAQTPSAITQATNAIRETIMPNNNNNNNNSGGSAGIVQIIPLTEIASLQLSVALDTVDQGPPFFLALPAPNILPSSLQVYTTRQLLFQFLGFESIAASAGAALSDAVKGRPIDRAYNFIDHAWRASTTVPLQGVNYAN